MEASVIKTNDELRAEVDEKNRIMREGTRKQQRILIAKDVTQLLEMHVLKAEHNGFVRFDEGLMGDEARAVLVAAGTSYSAQMDAKKVKELFERAEILESCTVCALGACTVSAIRLFDGFAPMITNNGTMFNAARVYDSDGGAESGNLIAYLQGFFEEKQMAMIEAAFERGAGFYGSDSPLVQNDIEYSDKDWETETEVECHAHDCSESEHTVTLYHKSEERVFPEWWRESIAFGRRHHTARQRLLAIMENIIENDGDFIPDVSVSELEAADEDGY